MAAEMNMGIADPYTHVLDLTATYVQQSFDNMAQYAENDWTALFCERMRAHTNLQDAIKGVANKRVRGSLDHAMTEALAMQMIAHLSRKRPDLAVCSERTIPRQKVKPDISVWNGDKCIAAVECKVQMGWSRGAVSKDFTAREAKLVGAGIPVQNIWHVVASQCNWMRDNDPKWGVRWLVVGEEYTGNWKPATIIHPLEPLFDALVNL